MEKGKIDKNFLANRDIMFLIRFLKETHLFDGFFKKLQNYKNTTIYNLQQYQDFISNRLNYYEWHIVYTDSRFYQLYNIADRIIGDEINQMLCKHGGLIYSCDLFASWRVHRIYCRTQTEEHDFWCAVLYQFIFFKLMYFAMLNKTTIDTSNLFCLPMIKTRNHE